MNDIKTKISTYKYLKVVFSIMLVIGVIFFLLFTSSVNNNGVRNGLISIILMIFGLVSNKYCDFQIYLLKKQSKLHKNKSQKRRKAEKIIEFNKIA